MIRRKRFGAITLAAAIAAMSVFPSFAADHVVDNTKKGAMTIYKYDITKAKKAGIAVSEPANGQKNESAETILKDYAIEGVEFTYLRVGDVDTYSKNGDVKPVYEIPEALQKILKLNKQDAVETKNEKDYYLASQIQSALQLVLSENISTKNKLEAYVKDGEKMSLTDANGKTVKTGLDLGLYLLVETKVPENVVDTTNPWFVQLPMTDAEGASWFYEVTCYPKNQTGDPTLDKRVKDRTDKKTGYKEDLTVSEGAKLDYRIVSRLPHITSTSTYLSKYAFKDEMDKGLCYGENAVLAFYDSTDKFETTNIDTVTGSGAVAVWTKDSGKFTQTYTSKEDGSSQMLIGMTKEGLQEINENYSDKYMVLYYTADMKSDNTVVVGDKGNSNIVTLEWRRTSEEYFDTLKAGTLLFTYGLQVKKTFSDGQGDPTNVQFLLQNKTENYYVKAVGSNGNYYVAGREEEKAKATVFRPAKDGTLLIHGLEGDAYTLTETHSDHGYSLLKEPLQIVIVPTKGFVSGAVREEDGSITITGASAKVDGTKATMINSLIDKDSIHALVKIEIQNAKGFSLPKTGGKGLYFVTIAGVILAGAGIMLTSKKDKTDIKCEK